MSKIIIFGNKDIAALIAFYLKHDSFQDPVAFCVDSDYLQENKFEGLPVIALENVVKEFPPSSYKFIVPLYNNKLRKNKFAEIENLGYEVISYVSSKATCWSKVGKNCVIMEDNTIQPFVSIGNNVILWSGNHIGHHSTIKDNVFFSSHVVLSGHCTVNEFCWLGVNSTIRDNVTLGEGTFVCMSTMIMSDTAPYKKYLGVPGKEVGDIK